MRKSRELVTILLCMGILSVCGCSNKKVKRPVFEIEERTEQSYELTKVVRETVQSTTKIGATYKQSRQDSPKFSVEGKQLKKVYVEKGDTVKAGQLLAELDMEGEESEFLDCMYSLNAERLQKTQLEEQRALAVKIAENKKNSVSAKEYNALKNDIQNKYDYPIEDLEDDIFLLERQYDMLQKQLEGSKIYAGIDGVVTELINTWGYVSETEAAFLTITDPTECSFEAYIYGTADYLREGETYIFSSSDGFTQYETVLEKIDRKEGKMYFVPKTEDLSIKVGTNISYVLVKDWREQVLSVPNASLHQANGQYYVYYIDGEGIRRIRHVTIGLVGDRTTEIIEGLSEGEDIILQ